MTDMECKKLIKAYPNKSATLAKKEAASSSPEALTSMVLLSSSDYNIFRFLMADLRQDIPKGNNNYPKTVTSAYDMIARS